MYNLPKRLQMVYSDIQSPVLTLFKTTVQRTALSVPLLSAKKQSVGHRTSSPSDVQTSKSTCPRCFVCLLPLSGPHPLTPVISLSAPKQTSLPDAEIRSGRFACVQISSSTRAGSRDEGKLSHVRNESEFLPLALGSRFY